MHEEETIAAIPESEAPGVDGLPLQPDYCDRGPRDVVLSGPLGFRANSLKTRVSGPGRWFESAVDAVHWAEVKYGADRVRLILGEGNTRWAVLIKNLLR